MQNPRIPFQLASDRRPLAPPGGKPLIVHVVVNVDNWRFDQPMPRKLLPAPHGEEHLPDVPNYSWAEYGMRCGMPRLFETLRRRGLEPELAHQPRVLTLGLHPHLIGVPHRFAWLEKVLDRWATIHGRRS